MTTLDPGASVVFTHGLRVRAASTALRASSAAPTITNGFDVFVQEVIAAITTDPWSTLVWVPSSRVTGDGDDGRSSSPPETGSEAGKVPARPLSRPGACTYEPSASRNACLALVSATRSCGRLGPASDGTTVDRSSSSRCEYLVASAASGSCQSPCSLAYASTRPTWSADRAVSRRYVKVSPSIGKIAQVDPNSGLMLPIVARLATGTAATPSPWNSTNLPTTPCRRSSSVTVRTRSVAVAPDGSSPVSLNPTTFGISIEIGWPSMAASASMPPTPQPSTPRPFSIVVCESVPTQVSG